MPKKKTIIIGILLHLIGWCFSQYALIPDFTIYQKGFFIILDHVQPSKDTADFLHSINWFISTIGAFVIARKFVIPHIICVFLLFGYGNNMIDEYAGTATHTTDSEKILLI